MLKFGFQFRFNAAGSWAPDSAEWQAIPCDIMHQHLPANCAQNRDPGLPPVWSAHSCILFPVSFMTPQLWNCSGVQPARPAAAAAVGLRGEIFRCSRAGVEGGGSDGSSRQCVRARARACLFCKRWWFYLSNRAPLPLSEPKRGATRQRSDDYMYKKQRAPV
jgi:hypothetical protein